MRHSRIKYCKSNESISFEKMIFSPRGKCAFFALKIISIFLILLLTFISWTLLLTLPFLQKLDNDALYIVTGIVLREKFVNLIAFKRYFPLFGLFL